MLVIKHTVIKLKNAFDEFINKLDMIKERISELKEMLIETTKYKKKVKKRTSYPRPAEQLQVCNIYVLWTQEGEKERKE